MPTAPTPAPALAGASLVPPALEAEFRGRTMAEDGRTARVLVAGFTALTLAFVGSDLTFVSGDALARLLAMRALHLGLSGVALVALHRTRSPGALDRIILAWSIGTSALNLVVLASRPPTHHLPVVIGAVTVAGYFALVPNRFAYQGVAACAAAAVEVAVLAAFREPLPWTSQAPVAGALGLALLGGGWTSWRLHGARRRAFLELRRAETARDDLARAAAEIRTLRGLVPICASCKAMRGPDGRWRELEEVLVRQTEAEFTHGICDRCVEKLYPVR